MDFDTGGMDCNIVSCIAFSIPELVELLLWRSNSLWVENALHRFIIRDFMLNQFVFLASCQVFTPWTQVYKVSHRGSAVTHFCCEVHYVFIWTGTNYVLTLAGWTFTVGHCGISRPIKRGSISIFTRRQVLFDRVLQASISLWFILYRDVGGTLVSKTWNLRLHGEVKLGSY